MRNLGNNNFCLRSVDFWHSGFPPYYIQKLHYIYIFKQLMFVMWTVNGFCSIVFLHPFGGMAECFYCVINLKWKYMIYSCEKACLVRVLGVNNGSYWELDKPFLARKCNGIFSLSGLVLTMILFSLCVYFLSALLSLPTLLTLWLLLLFWLWMELSIMLLILWTLLLLPVVRLLWLLILRKILLLWLRQFSARDAYKII